MGVAIVMVHAEMIVPWARAFLLSALLAFPLVGCANQSTDNRQFVEDSAPKTPEMSPAAQREHLRILAAYGGAYEQPQMEALLAQTVDRLVAASERPDIKYKITVLNSPAINAFALDGGQLYVTRGLLALANDSSELASVLSHEMAHVIARHAAFRENEMRRAQVFSRVASELLGDPQMGALALARSKIALASFSRAQEFEADGIGVGISARAGFDPYGAQRFLTSMGLNAELKSRGTATGSDQRPPDFLSSHPSTPERVRNARANARQYSSPGNTKRDRNEYLALLEGLIYGDDPSDGFIRGRRFLHPKLGFAFTAPDGFVLDNTAQALFGVKDGGTQALRLDVVRAADERNLADYFSAAWMENIDRDSVSELAINGQPAATALAHNNDWTFRLYLLRHDGDIYRFIFATKQQTEAADRAFRESIASFRRINPAETASAKPIRIKIVKVTADSALEKYARRMQLRDHALERFRVLNGLGPSDKLKQGDLVKIVVE